MSIFRDIDGTLAHEEPQTTSEDTHMLIIALANDLPALTLLDEFVAPTDAGGRCSRFEHSSFGELGPVADAPNWQYCQGTLVRTEGYVPAERVEEETVGSEETHIIVADVSSMKMTAACSLAGHSILRVESVSPDKLRGKRFRHDEVANTLRFSNELQRGQMRSIVCLLHQLGVPAPSQTIANAA